MARSTLLGFAMLLIAMPLIADDLTGSNRFLCTPVDATVCSIEGECKSESPLNLNIPHFIQVDLGKKMLSTTAASGENRSTPIRTLMREDGLIVLQGVQDERAFSFVISEVDGMASIAVARDGVTVSAFGACTPLDGGQE